jgi:hypothetical protein
VKNKPGMVVAFYHEIKTLAARIWVYPVVVDVTI